MSTASMVGIRPPGHQAPLSASVVMRIPLEDRAQDRHEALALLIVVRQIAAMGSDTVLARLQRMIDEEPVAGMLLDPAGPTLSLNLFAVFGATSIILGLVLAVAQPSSAIDLSFMTSWLFWLLHGAAGFAIILALEWVLLETDMKRPWRLILALGILPLLLAPISIALDDGFQTIDDAQRAESGWLERWISEVIDIAPLAIIIAALALLILKQLTNRPTSADTAEEKGRLSDILPGFPAHLGDDLLRVSAQDHYCEIVTSEGVHLLTSSFAECVAKLEAFDGVQVHRSHWIVLDHVADLSTSGSSYECRLSNGDSVPLSRRRYSTLRHVIRAHLQSK